MRTNTHTYALIFGIILTAAGVAAMTRADIKDDANKDPPAIVAQSINVATTSAAVGSNVKTSDVAEAVAKAMGDLASADAGGAAYAAHEVDTLDEIICPLDHSTAIIGVGDMASEKAILDDGHGATGVKPGAGAVAPAINSITSATSTAGLMRNQRAI